MAKTPKKAKIVKTAKMEKMEKKARKARKVKMAKTARMRARKDLASRSQIGIVCMHTCIHAYMRTCMRMLGFQDPHPHVMHI